MSTLELYRELWRRLPLVRFMVARSRRSAVSATVLKSGWNLLNPLAQMLVYYFLVEIIFDRGSNYGVSAAVLIFVGIVHFQFLSSVLVGACGTMRSNRSLLLQTPLPPTVFVATVVGESLVTLLQSMVIAVGLMIVLGVEPSMNLLAYPLLLLVLVGAAWSLGIALAVLGLLLADLREILTVMLKFLLYTSPVLYPLAIVPEGLETIYLLNPLAVWFGCLQWSLYGLAPPAAWSIVVATCGCLILLPITHLVYLRLARPVTRLL
ncbi:MAG: ABC transporter permease [Phycisphaeraceae bacterium]|nr:ABC transporter permease [Phycisphaeraceae bacterium]